MRKSTKGLLLWVTLCIISAIIFMSLFGAYNNSIEGKKKIIINNLKSIEGKQTLTGHWTTYQPPWYKTFMSQVLQIQNTTGKYPFIIAGDYRNINNTVDYSFTNSLFINHTKKGGYAMLVVDWINPNTTDNARNRSVSIREVLTSGTKSNTNFLIQLNAVAKGLQELQDNKVIVLFDTFHEMNADYFWWGKRTPQDYKDLYIYTHNFMYKKGIHNLLYMYTPDTKINWSGSWYNPNVTDYYPGNEYVDIVALDYYGVNINNIQNYYDAMLTLNKPFGFAEFGHASWNNPINYSALITLNAIKEKYPKTTFIMSYLDVWSMANQQNIYQFFNDPRMVNLK